MINEKDIQKKYIAIQRKNGAVYLQWAGPVVATDDPLTVQDEIIIELWNNYREKCEECALWQKSEKECNEAYKKLSDEFEMVRQKYANLWKNEIEIKDLLWDVMCSGVTDPHPTISFVEVQIDKETWNAIPAALKKEEVK